MTTRVPARLAAPLAALSVMAALISGCQSPPARQVAAADDPDQRAFVAQARERIEAAQARIDAHVPPAGPPIQKQKSVVLIPCTLAAEGCGQPALGAEEAAKAAGWTVRIIDGKNTADTQNSAVQQALALNPDGIMTFAIDPGSIQGSLAQARKRGVKVVASAAMPSDLVDFYDNPSVATYQRTGSLLADHAIVRHKGNVKAVVLHDTGFGVLQPRYESFMQGMKACASCEVLDIQHFTFADMENSLPRIAQQVAQRYPDLNTIYVDYDDAVPFVRQGLRAVGRQDQLVLASNGTSDAIERIRAGDQDATTAFSLRWIGWSAVDSMNRIFAGEDPADSTYSGGVKLIDAGNAEGISGLWEGDVDFRGKFRTLWGLDQ